MYPFMKKLYDSTHPPSFKYYIQMIHLDLYNLILNYINYILLLYYLVY